MYVYRLEKAQSFLVTSAQNEHIYIKLRSSSPPRDSRCVQQVHILPKYTSITCSITHDPGHRKMWHIAESGFWEGHRSSWLRA